MDSLGISAVAVVGAGTMGAGIAGMFARTGCRVHLVDLSDALLDRAMARLRLGQEALVEAGLLCSRERGCVGIARDNDYGPGRSV